MSSQDTDKLPGRPNPPGEVNVYVALRNAQAEFPTIHKGRTAKVEMRGGGSYSYTYADLGDILAAVTPVLLQHGLTLTQTFRVQEDPAAPPILVTTLATMGVAMHPGTLVSELPIAYQGGPQDLGSFITYARRYAICAILGITAEEDDDGASAQRSGSAGSPRSDDRPGVRTQVPGTTTSRKAARPASSVKPSQVKEMTSLADALPIVPRGTIDWQKKIGWGKTTFHGKLISTYTWNELVDGAAVDGGRMAWLQAQLGWLNEQIGTEFEAWARDRIPYVETAIAEIRRRHEENGPPITKE